MGGVGVKEVWVNARCVCVCEPYLCVGRCEVGVFKCRAASSGEL